MPRNRVLAQKSKEGKRSWEVMLAQVTENTGDCGSWALAGGQVLAGGCENMGARGNRNPAQSCAVAHGNC